MAAVLEGSISALSPSPRWGFGTLSYLTWGFTPGYMPTPRSG